MTDKDFDPGLPGVPGVFPAEPDDRPVWFGIMFTDSTVTVKRYFEYGDVQEAEESDFVAYVTRFITADNRTEAMAEAQRLITARYAL